MNFIFLFLDHRRCPRFGKQSREDFPDACHWAPTTVPVPVRMHIAA